MTRAAFVFALGFGLLAVTVQQAMAQAPCAPRESAIAQLAEKWGETRQTVMLAQGTVFEVWANADEGTWTILETMPSGMACIRASGVAYEDVSALVTGDPA